MLEDKSERTALRKVINKAEDEEIFSKEEIGFVITLVERFRSDIDKKTKQLYMLQGEIAQLKLNERIIIQLIDNILAAAKRDEDRQKTMDILKGKREEGKHKGEKEAEHVVEAEVEEEE